MRDITNSFYDVRGVSQTFVDWREKILAMGNRNVICFKLTMHYKFKSHQNYYHNRNFITTDHEFFYHPSYKCIFKKLTRI